jgi:hypothetical protein
MNKHHVKLLETMFFTLRRRHGWSVDETLGRSSCRPGETCGKDGTTASGGDSSLAGLHGGCSGSRLNLEVVC